MSEQQRSGAQSQAILYSNPQPLTPELHGDLGLKKLDRPLDFAKPAHAVPINAFEFNFALKNFPIVFVNAQPPMPVAVMGLEQGDNLFVTDEGTWREGAYIPAYIRRYPFILGANKDQTQMTLCIEAEAEVLGKEGDPKLFENNQPTEHLNQALEFCKSFHQHYVMTRQLAEELQKLDLFTTQQAAIKNQSGQQLNLGSYLAVDENKLNALTDEQFLELRKKNILPLIYLHLASLSNWGRLAELKGISPEHPQGNAAAGPSPVPGVNGAVN